MTQNEIRTFIRKEIDKLNRKIDQKIILGKSYTKEAATHYELIQKLKALA